MRLPRTIEIGGSFLISFLGTFHVVVLLVGPQEDLFTTPQGGLDQSHALTKSMRSTLKMGGHALNLDQAHKGGVGSNIASTPTQGTPASSSASRASLSNPAGAAAAAKTAAQIVQRPQRLVRKVEKPKFHTAMTCDSSGYSKWQSRVMYFWYKHFRGQPNSGMGAFSRVLHTGKSDELMEEIPTFIVDPLPAEMLQGYVVLNRPHAFEQWITKAEIEEEYVWMAEPDHLIVRPIPNLAVGDSPSAFPFFYIEPKKFEAILRKWFTDTSRPITDIDPVGNSPVILKKEQLKQIAPLWKKISLEMKRDPEADKAFGWVQEMYAYSVAAALCGVKHILHRNWMIQPPWDKTLGDTYIIHYTYGQDFTLEGKQVVGKVGPWHFDKRDYGASPPRNLSMPPKGTPESVVTLLSMINEATASIPDWKAGVH